MSFALGILPVALLLLGFPIFVVLLAGVSVALVFFMNIPYAALHQTMFGAIDAFALLAVPFFLYAGEVMGRGTVAQRIVDVVQAGIGRVPGSLAITSVGTSAIFGAISGASSATVATIGRIMVPAMRERKYPETFSAGLITSVGAIDIIIPPSIPMILYGATAQESVPKLYAAGLGPGLLIALMLATYVFFYARRRGIDIGASFDASRLLRALARGTWALGAPFIILGGVYGGVFSPTEAASVACLYAVIVTRIVYRDISWREILECAARTVRLTAQVFVIVACASVFSWLLTVNQVPASLVQWLQEMKLGPVAILAAINVLLLIVGCFVDPLSAIIMLTPLLVPIIKAAGIDTVHFGIIVTVNLAIGLFTPPFGINIFVAQAVLKFPAETIVRGLWPFFILYFVALMIITYVPAIALSGVRLFF
ncbi:MAG: TRAP transporter large permease [Burkholderiales bacterium]